MCGLHKRLCKCRIVFVKQLQVANLLTFPIFGLRFNNYESFRKRSGRAIFGQTGSTASRSIMWAVFFNVTITPMIAGLVFKENQIYLDITDSKL